MKKGKKLLVMLLALTMIVGVLSGCGGEPSKTEQPAASDATSENGGEGPQIVFKLSNVFTAEQPLNVTLYEVAENIKERTNGAIEIQIYPNGEIATYKDGIEQVRSGAPFISNEDPSYMGDYVPDYNALVGPMLYNDLDEYSAVCHSDFAKELNAKAEEQGMKVLALDYGFGFRHLCLNKPVEGPEDLKGVKLRVPKSNLWIETLGAMGANPIPMAWSEVYSGVQQGVIDGLETSISDIADNKMGAIIKDITLTGHFCGTTCIVMSKEIWDTLTPEQQQIMAEEFEAGAKRNNERVIAQEKVDRENLAKEGVEFHEVDKEAFRELTKKVFEEDTRLTPGVYDRIQGILEDYRAANK